MLAYNKQSSIITLKPKKNFKLLFYRTKKTLSSFRARSNKQTDFFHVYFWSLCARFNFRSLPLYKYLNCAPIDHPPLASFSMTAALWRHKELESALESQPSSVEEQRDALMGPRFPWLRLPRALARGQQPEKKKRLSHAKFSDFFQCLIGRLFEQQLCHGHHAVKHKDLQ